MDLELEGRRALVLGSSSGLGRAVAVTLVAEGAAVAVVSRDREKYPFDEAFSEIAIYDRAANTIAFPRQLRTIRDGREMSRTDSAVFKLPPQSVAPRPVSEERPR